MDTETMRALVLADFGRMRVEERPRPHPGPDEALVRTVATGICGSDLHGYTGATGRRRPGQVMGHETVGVVEQLGRDGAPQVAVGDTVVLNPMMPCGACARCRAGQGHVCADRRLIGVDPTISAAFADYVLAPATNLVRFDGEPLHGALVEPLAVGFHAAVRGGVTSASTVLVIGGGPIGQACALACRRLGAAGVLVSEAGAARRDLVATLGFDVVDPAAEDVLDRVRAVTGGDGTSVAIDAVGVSATLATALSATAPGGVVVLVGMGAPSLEVAAYDVSTAERAVVGAFCYSASEFAGTAAWTAEHGAEVAPLISGVVAPEDADAAFAALADGSSTASKILVSFSGSAAR